MKIGKYICELCNPPCKIEGEGIRIEFVKCLSVEKWTPKWRKEKRK